MDNQKKSTIYFFAYVIILAVLLLITGCEPDCSDGNYKPYDCLDREPSEGILRIEATLDGLNPVVPIEVYYGDYENDLLYFVDTLDTKEGAKVYSCVYLEFH